MANTSAIPTEAMNLPSNYRKYLLDFQVPARKGDPSAFPTELYLTAFEHPKTPTDREIVKSLGQQALKVLAMKSGRAKQLGLVITLPLFLLAFTNFSSRTSRELADRFDFTDPGAD